MSTMSTPSPTIAEALQLCQVAAKIHTANKTLTLLNAKIAALSEENSSNGIDDGDNKSRIKSPLDNCTPNIHQLCVQLVSDNKEYYPIVRLARTKGRPTCKMTLNRKLAMMIITTGLCINYNGQIFPTSKVDLETELTITTQYKEHYTQELADLFQRLNITPYDDTQPSVRFVYEAIFMDRLHLNVIDQQTQQIKPQQFDLDCRLTTLIGQGAFGKVFRVYDRTTQQFYAIKTIKIKNSISARELNVSQTLANLDCSIIPFIIKPISQYYEYGSTRGFVVMEYAEYDQVMYTLMCQRGQLVHSPTQQQTIQQLIQVDNNQQIDVISTNSSIQPSSATKIDIKLIMDITLQLMLAVQYLHTHHIAHRNIKPSNFVLLPIAVMKTLSSSTSSSLSNNITSELNELSSSSSTTSTTTKNDEIQNENKKDNNINNNNVQYIVKLLDYGTAKLFPSASSVPKNQFQRKDERVSVGIIENLNTPQHINITNGNNNNNNTSMSNMNTSTSSPTLGFEAQGQCVVVDDDSGLTPEPIALSEHSIDNGDVLLQGFIDPSDDGGNIYSSTLRNDNNDDNHITNKNNLLQPFTSNDLYALIQSQISPAYTPENVLWSEAMAEDLYAIAITTLQLVFGYSPGSFSFYKKNQYEMIKTQDISTQRNTMKLVQDYIDEYQMLCNDLQLDATIRVNEMLQYPEFLQILNILVAIPLKASIAPSSTSSSSSSYNNEFKNDLNNLEFITKLTIAKNQLYSSKFIQDGIGRLTPVLDDIFKSTYVNTSTTTVTSCNNDNDVVLNSNVSYDPQQMIKTINNIEDDDVKDQLDYTGEVVHITSHNSIGQTTDI